MPPATLVAEKKRFNLLHPQHHDARTLSLTSRMPTSYNTLHNDGIQSLHQSFTLAVHCANYSPLATFSGMGIGPPGESAVRAVRISQPFSVTRSVCSAKSISGMSHKQWILQDKVDCKRTELGCSLSVNGCAGPVIGPSNVSVLAHSNHRLNGKGHSNLALAHSLVLGIVRDVGRAVEELSDAVAAVRSNYAAVLLLCNLFDNVSKLSDQDARLDSLDGLVERLTCCLHYSYAVGIGLGPVANVVCLVKIGVVSTMVQADVDVEDIAVEENALIGNTVADDFVDGRTA